MKSILYILLSVGFVVSTWILLGCSGAQPAPSTVGTGTLTQIIPSTVTPTQAPVTTATAAVSSTPAASATTAPAPSHSETELKYRLIEEFNTIFFCDRDLYPVAREVSDQEITQRVAELRQNAEVYTVILKYLGLQDVTTLSSGQNRAIDAEHKRLNAIQLQSDTQGYTFQLRTSENGERGLAVQGTISPTGVITVTQQEPTIMTCPICLAGSTRIDTPQGAVAIRDLQKGMLVWTLGPSGEREPAPILQTVRRPMPQGASIVHLVLDDGRELFISAMHPMIQGEPVGNLRIGDMLDNARVLSVQLTPLEDDATYDILPAGATGVYWANGILLGSTLRR